jgi:hypothetical protein
VITETDLYALGMESPTAWHLMPELCEKLGIAFPPENREPPRLREMADPFKNTEKAQNEHSRNDSWSIGNGKNNQLAQPETV